MKKLISIILCLCLLLSLAACGGESASSTPAAEPTVEPTPEPTPEPTSEPLVDEAALALDLSDAQWEESADGSYYQLLDVAFCTNVLVEKYQTMNIYVPAEYFEGGEVCGYTADTAPIVLQNNCSGWRSGEAGNVDKTMIENGFVFVNCGARSRDAADGTGKAPAPVVDLKSAVRTLRLNADIIPGDEEKIISIGTSGGGQMSSILGASGNMEEYYSYLYENGAPGLLYDEAADSYISTINDDVFGCMCYCPIADIENADLAYAWWRYDSGDTSFSGMFGAGGGDFTEFQLALQDDLAVAFCEYINTLGIANEDGETLSFDVSVVDKETATSDPRIGSYYEQVLENMSDAFNAFIAANTDAEGNFSYTKSAGKGGRGPMGGNGSPSGSSSADETTAYDSLEAYIASLENSSKWLVKNEDGTYSITDMAGFLAGTGLSRNKDIPGFDTFDLSAENDAFGTADEDAVHFSASVAAVLEANYDEYAAMEGFDAAIVSEYIEQANRDDIADQTYLMNATAIMLNVASGEQVGDPADHWRTRNGTADEHTSFSIAYNLAMSAKMAGAESVDYSLVWAMNHGSDEGTSTGTFADWVHSICGGIVEQPEEAANAGTVGGASGNYSYNETNDFGLSIAWTLTLNEDGTYVLTEANEFVGEMSYNGTGYTIDGDTVVCSSMVEGPAMFEWANPAGFTATINGSEFVPVA